MKHVSDNDELLIKYLLGELGDAEQEGVELRYISDPRFYEHLLAVEDDLIDAYVEGELPESQRPSFENHFLRSAARRTRVGFARAWAVYAARQSNVVRVEPKPARQRSLFRFLDLETWPAALRVAAILLVVLGAGSLAAEVLRLSGRVDQAESQRATLERRQRELERQIDEERLHSQGLNAELERERDRQTPVQAPPDQMRSGLISFLLAPGLVRGTGDVKKRIIPNDAQQVNLQLSFNGDGHESYLVTIRTVEGREIWRRAVSKAQSKGGARVVSVQVAANLFATEDYIVTLSATADTGSPEKLAEYFFSAARK